MIGQRQCNCHTGSALTCPIHTQADFDAADRARAQSLTACEQPEITDQVLLYAYCAAEYASIATAINALADQGQAGRRAAHEAQERGDTCSWMWASLVGLGNLDDPTDRIIEIRQWLAEHVAELEEMKTRLAI